MSKNKGSHKDWEIEIATCILLMGKLAMSNLAVSHKNCKDGKPISTSTKEMAAETMALLQTRLCKLLLIEDDIILAANKKIDSGMDNFQTQHLAMPN